jgi:class 3 adenylate cyclase/tetratricopeptide (TPR) repeat protein
MPSTEPSYRGPVVDPVAQFVSRRLAGWSEALPWHVVSGSVIFADVSGFTALSERLARRGKVGAEQLTDLLDTAFDRLLSAAYGYGGDLLAFGGDALFLLFDGDGHASRADATAQALLHALRSRPRDQSEMRGVRLGISIGVDTGPVYLFKVGICFQQLLAIGPTVTGVLRLEQSAGTGELNAGDSFRRALEFDARSPAEGWSAASATNLLASRADDLLDARVRTHVRGGSVPEHRSATTCFIKADGTDELLHRNTIETVHAVLEALISHTQTVAERHEVALLEADVYPDGLKLLMTAGVPIAAGDDLDRMISAAREIVAFDSPLSLRAGLHAGRLFAGTIGSAQRRSFTVMGEAVNLAARLMAHAPTGEVLATDSSLKAARSRYDHVSLAPFKVKGLTAPVHASLVKRPQERAARSPNVQAVGRDAELALLEDAWATARSGSGCAVEIVGEAGIGKTTLAQALLDVVPDAAVHRIHGRVYGTNRAYLAVTHMLLQLAAIDPDTDERARARLLEEWLHAVAPELLPWRPLIAIVFGTQCSPTPETAALAPEFRGSRLAAVIRDLLTKVIQGAAVFFVDDAHWLDPASRELLRVIGHSVSSRPWLLLITRRPAQGVFELPSDMPVDSLHLASLNADALIRLSDNALSATPLPKTTVDAIVHRSAGNPFFLRELLAAAQHRAIDELPQTIEGLLASEVDTLSPRDRQVLRQAAVLGDEFDSGLFAEVVGPELAHETRPRLERFLLQDGSRTVFRHGLLREAAYGGLPFRHRTELHLNVAHRIESRVADPRERAEELALHYFEGRAFESALHYNRIAATRAREDLAPLEAASYLERAAACARTLKRPAHERAQLEEERADVEERAGRYENAESALRRARRLVDDDPISEARLLQKLGWIRQTQGRLSSALSLYTRASRLIDAVDSSEVRALREDLQVARAGIKERQGRLRECIALLEASLPGLRQRGNAKTLAHAEFLLDSALSDLGRADDHAHAYDALHVYRTLGDRHGEMLVLNNLGVEVYFEGRWSASRELYEQSFRAATAIGAAVEAATVSNNIGEILSDQGHFADAEVHFREALRVWRGAPYSLGVALATSNLGRLATRSGESEHPQKLLDDAERIFTMIGAQPFVIEVRGRRAEALLSQGFVDDALTLVRVLSAAQLTDEPRPLLATWLPRLEACARFRRGEVAEAERAFAVSELEARAADLPFELALTLEATAIVNGSSSVEASTIFEQLGVIRTSTLALLGRG